MLHFVGLYSRPVVGRSPAPRQLLLVDKILLVLVARSEILQPQERYSFPLVLVVLHFQRRFSALVPRCRRLLQG